MIAISICGPFTSLFINKYGFRPVATTGMLMCAVSFWGLAMTNFDTQHIQAWSWMVLMGISVEIALLSSTAAIMSAVPAHKATAAGAIEGMAYELGAGLGITIFGLMLSYFYTQAIILPENLAHDLGIIASASIGEAMRITPQLEPSLMQNLTSAASEAFTHSHSRVLSIAGIMFFILSLFVYIALPRNK